MKHPVHTKHNGYTAEWLQALFTLLVLSSLYYYSVYYDQKSIGIESSSHIRTSLSYWNGALGYGFHANDEDVYTSLPTNALSAETIQAHSSGSTDTLPPVTVSFYKENISLNEAKKIHTGSSPMVFTELLHGVAVVEGDLTSSRAKNILATLSPR